MIAVEIKIFQKLIVDMAFKLIISILDETVQLKYFETSTVSYVLSADSWLYALNFFKLLIKSW